MKRFWAGFACAAMLMGILSGCKSPAAGQPSPLDGEDLTGWELSEDASYSLTPEQGVSGVLQKSGGRYLSTGEIRPAYAVSGGKLTTERVYSALETESYWRGLFFTADDWTAADGETVSARITTDVGSIAGICVGTDAELNNGFAAVLHLAKQRLEIMRVNQGILTSLETYQDGVTTSAVSVETGGSYTLAVSLTPVGENAFHMAVDVDGIRRLETTLEGYGVAQGRGNQVSLVVSDMKGSFEALRLGEQTAALDDSVRTSTAGLQAVDEAFQGTLTSEPFTINSRYLAFRAGGGSDTENLKICLTDAKTGEALLTETGSGSEEMTRRVWDVQAYAGRSCRIQITDTLKSGHLNVDSFFATDEMPLDTRFSLLNSQVGYETHAAKKAYIRAPGETAFSPASFAVRRFDTGEPVYEGRIRELGAYWESSWWELDFSDFREAGRYVVTVGEDRDLLISTAFEIGDSLLVNETLLDTSLNQLDLRRSPGKMGWRDSSTDELRELHAQVMTVHTMLDILETEESWLSPYNRARVLDNIAFGLQYILAAQERTDDPLTDGRFIHDLYPSQFSAHELRTWFDMTYAMSALARAYPVLQTTDAPLAQQVKAAFDLSFDLCVRRPYYLPEELDVEGAGGRERAEAAIRQLYYLREMNWTFDYSLRTRDKLMFLTACTYMAKADSDPKYLEQAKVLAREVSAQQYTDYQNPIDGAYGCFYEFENNREAMMLEWIQSTNLLLGNQTPTDLQPFMDLLELAPGDPDAAMWYNTLQIYVDGYVKPTAQLTPLGIYPVAAYNNDSQRGIRFFQALSHGASSHFGFMGRNLQKLAGFFGDAELQKLAENNVQFQAGLNPGFPTGADQTAWKSYSLLYLVGSRYFKGNFNGGAYVPPIGSGFNGFSASPQFSVGIVDQYPDLPLGILDDNGQYQFNEDYIPHGMGYASGIAAVESPAQVTVRTQAAGQPVQATIRFSGAAEGTVQADETGTALLTGLPRAGQLTLEITYGQQTARRELALTAGQSRPVTVDFSEDVQAVLTVPESLSGEGTGTLSLTNRGPAALTASVAISADGAAVGETPAAVALQPGETVTLELTLTAGDERQPYLIYAYVTTPHSAAAVTAGGRIA